MNLSEVFTCFLALSVLKSLLFPRTLATMSHTYYLSRYISSIRGAASASYPGATVMASVCMSVFYVAGPITLVRTIRSSDT